MTERGTPPLRHRWRDRVKSADGPDDPMLRLVLLVLGDWSKVSGGPFSVKNTTLCEQTGLVDSALRDRLKQAEGVWFTRERRPGRPSVFRLRIPSKADGVPEIEDVRGRDNAPWSGRVENSADPAATAADPATTTPPPRRRTPQRRGGGPLAATAADIDVPIHKTDVARGRARPVESLARSAPDPVPVDDGDDQLEIAHFLLEAIKGGNHDDFNAASELLSERTQRERQQRSSGGSG